MKKTLKEVNQGQDFIFAGIKWTVLDRTAAGTLALSSDVLEERAFDNDNSNDWRKSSIREYLNGEFLQGMIANGAEANSFREMTVDLTSDDGMTDYGEDVCKIALLTADQYRKYRRFIKNASNWWWLATAYSCLASYSGSARIVNSDGSLHYDVACNGASGVRPACILSSKITVEVEGENQEDEKTQEIFRNAVQTWGKEAQVDMMIEEMAELTKELLNERRGREYDIAEEMADVRIMLAQMEIIFQNAGEVEQRFFEKVARLDLRLQESKGGASDE